VRDGDWHRRKRPTNQPQPTRLLPMLAWKQVTRNPANRNAGLARPGRREIQEDRLLSWVCSALKASISGQLLTIAA
jgi:hypothetical protein